MHVPAASWPGSCWGWRGLWPLSATGALVLTRKRNSLVHPHASGSGQSLTAAPACLRGCSSVGVGEEDLGLCFQAIRSTAFMSADGRLPVLSLSNHNKPRWPDAAGVQTTAHSHHLHVGAAAFAAGALPAPQNLQGAMQALEEQSACQNLPRLCR